MIALDSSDFLFRPISGPIVEAIVLYTDPARTTRDRRKARRWARTGHQRFAVVGRHPRLYVFDSLVAVYVPLET